MFIATSSRSLASPSKSPAIKSACLSSGDCLVCRRGSKPGSSSSSIPISFAISSISPNDGIYSPPATSPPIDGSCSTALFNSAPSISPSSSSSISANHSGSSGKVSCISRAVSFLFRKFRGSTLLFFASPNVFDNIRLHLFQDSLVASAAS